MVRRGKDLSNEWERPGVSHCEPLSRGRAPLSNVCRCGGGSIRIVKMMKRLQNMVKMIKVGEA